MPTPQTFSTQERNAYIVLLKECNDAVARGGPETLISTPADEAQRESLRDVLARTLRSSANQDLLPIVAEVLLWAQAFDDDATELTERLLQRFCISQIARLAEAGAFE